MKACDGPTILQYTALRPCYEIKAAALAASAGDDALTAEQSTALVHSVARGEARFQAGEGIPDEAVFASMRSCGTEDELPPGPENTLA